jgi:hypothetical protein
MMTVASTVSSLLGSHSESKPSQPDDRWMATYPRSSRLGATGLTFFDDEVSKVFGTDAACLLLTSVG